MNLIDRYVGRTVLAAVGVIALVIGALVVLIAFINEIENVGSGNYGFVRMMAFIGLQLPAQMLIVMPVVVLLGALSGLGTLAANSELIVIRGAGVSMRRLAGSVGWAGFLLAALTLAVSAYLGPLATGAGISLKQQALGAHSQHTLGQGLWLRQKNTVIRLSAALPGGRVSGVTLYQFNNKSELTRAITAPSGHLESGHLVLDHPQISSLSLKHIDTSAPREKRLSFAVDKQILDLAITQPDQLTIVGLWRYIHFLQANDTDSASYRLAFWQRLMKPVTVWVLSIFALPFAFGALRGGGAGQRLFIGGLGGFAFFLVNSIIGSTAPVYGVAPWLAASLPTILLAVATAWWIRRLS